MSIRRSLIACLLIAIGCASSTGTGPGTGAATDASSLQLRIEQLPTSDFVVEDRGAVSIAYQLEVRNQSDAPITLRELTMEAVGRSPYVLRNGAVSFKETIAPGETRTLPFSMWAYSHSEGTKKGGATVYVRGVAQFETASGTRRKPFNLSFREPK